MTKRKGGRDRHPGSFRTIVYCCIPASSERKIVRMAFLLQPDVVSGPAAEYGTQFGVSSSDIDQPDHEWDLDAWPDDRLPARFVIQVGQASRRGGDSHRRYTAPGF